MSTKKTSSNKRMEPGVQSQAHKNVATPSAVNVKIINKNNSLNVNQQQLLDSEKRLRILNELSEAIS